MPSNYYAWQDDILLFNVFLQPRASRNALLGLHDNAIKIALTSPPIDGEANKQLIQFLAKLFRVKKSSIAISSGAHHRRKRISVCEPSQFPAEFFK
ncbi:MAG: DUF167 family protein [Cycloclasticus sp.]